MEPDVLEKIKSIENQIQQIKDEIAVSKDVVKTCNSCSHYIQHYYLDKKSGEYTELYCGHCIFPRIKDRKPDKVGCQYWEKADVQETA